MGYRFLDDYDPRKETKKKQNGALSAPRSGNSANPFTVNNKKQAATATDTRAAATGRTTRGAALGGSAVTPVQLPKRQLTVPKLTKVSTPAQKTTAQAPKQLKLPAIQAFGASMPTARKQTEPQRTAKQIEVPAVRALGAGDYSTGAKKLDGFFTRAGKTILGGSKSSLASNMDAMGAAYEAGQGGRTRMNEAELREAQWAVARAKRAYDLDRSQTAKNELDAALVKMKAFSTVLGKGAYEQALAAAYDAAAKIGTSNDLSALYNSLGRVKVDASTGVQQRATEAARDLALGVQASGGKDIEEAKSGLGKFGQIAVDAGASGVQTGIDMLLNTAMGTPGSKLPLAFRAYGGAAMQARADGGDVKGQSLYGSAVAAKEVATEMLFNIALPFAKAYGGGALDDMVQNGIRKAVDKLGKTEAGKRVLNTLLQAGASGVSEGLEEFIGDWMEWQMPRLYGGEVSSASETLANALYDFTVGGLSGLGGAAISPGTYRLQMPRLTTYAERQATEASGQRTATRYTAEEAAAKRKDARTFRNIIAGIDTSISDFFDRWKNGRKSHLGEKLEQLYIAPMPNNMAENISKIVGYNVNGRDFIVTSDDVKHVMDQHGNPDAEIAKGNIPLETWMLDALSDVVTNPDSIEPGNLGTGNKNAGKRGIVFSKAFPGGKIITIQFDNKGRGTLELNTMYAKESAILEVNDANAPNTFTPEAAKSALSYAEKTRKPQDTMPDAAESAAPVINVQDELPQSFSSETSVPQSGTGVNIQGMQNGGEYAAAPAAPLKMPRLTTYEERAGENNNSPAQDAVYSRQRVGGTDIPLGVSATQESSTIVPRTGENGNPLSEILRGAKEGRVDTGEAMQAIGGEELARALDTGEYAADAKGMLYQVKPEEHIDQRASYQVGSRKMKAFQFDHPELHPYYAEAAGELLYELDSAQPGGEVIELPGNEPPFESRYIRTSRVATDRIAYLLDDQRLSYADIEKALHAIVEDKGQENFAAAKRVELLLDNMLTNGYRAIYGETIPPNGEYIRLKQEIPGADGFRPLQMPQLTTYEQRTAAERQAGEQDRVTRLVDQIDALNAAVEQAPAPAAEMTQEEADHSDYLDQLARDENVFTSDPYTVADRLYDLQLRQAQRQEAPPERPVEQTAQEDLDELAGMFSDLGNYIGSREDRIRETEGMVSDHTTAVEKTGKEKASEAWSYFYRKMVDAGHSVSKFAQAVNDPYLYQIYNQARASSSTGVSMITDAQTNVNAQKVGESLNGIFSPIRAKGEDYYHAFQMYLFDLHNIDRMSLSQNKEAAVLEATTALNEFDANHPEMRTSTEAQLARMTESLDPDVAELAREKMRLLQNVNRADAIKDKPVFSFDVTADVSRERARRMLEQHPEFGEYRQQVRGYIDNLMQYRVDSGLMTQADADYLKRLYPNYVPTMRVGVEQAGAGRDRNAVRIGRTVGRAEGGTANLVPLHEALGRQTMKVVREGSKNRFGQRLLDDFVRAGENSKAARYVQEANEYEHEFTPDALDDMSREQLTRDKTLTVFKDGKLWELTVDDTMFDALKALSPDAAESNAVTRAVRAANNLFKSLVTGYNPTFTIRNTVRDLQTAGLYTRDGVAFARNYPKALAEIKNNGEYWQMYKALGGSFSSVFDYATGTVKEPKGRAAKLMAKIEALNMTMEQAPRLAEFMSVVEKGGTSTENLADALYAAADVTVNFGRAGTLGKVLNANYVPFLNPGIQGFDKLVRRVTETKGGKEWAKLIVRAAALGVAPALLNSLLYHDDEEWDDLRDSDKDTNYMFKLGNGTWLKIPKGRELSLLGITADRIGDALRGEDVDLIATLNTMGNQVAPANPLTSNIASALFEAQLFDPSSPGRTWYGGDIENQRLQSYAPGQRYDSSTDVFSKAVGGALGISPKKLNYVLDQYSGVVGDFLLPLLTPQAERGMFSKAFTVDAVTSNRLSGDFYDETDALTYAKNGGDTAAGVVSRFWSKQQSACSDLYKKIRDVEASDLSDREKRQKTRELKALVNGIQKNAMAVEDTYRAAVEKNLRQGMDADDAYRAANKDCFGAEYALQVYSKDVYEKAKNAKNNGVSYDDYYTYYFGTKGLKTTDEISVTTQKFDWLQSSGMDLTSQAEIYFADMASDDDLEKSDALKEAGITAEQYYQYKVATSGLTKREAKLNAINTLDLTDSQKDALYYLNSYASSTHGKAPWVLGMTAGQSEAQLAVLLAAEEDDGDDTPKWQQSLNSYLGKSETSSGGSRFLAQFAKKNGYTLQESSPSAPRYSSYLQYLAARDGISLDAEEANPGLQSKYLREFASRWGR